MFAAESRSMALSGDRALSSRFVSLNGPWRFRWAPSFAERPPPEFAAPDFDDSSWGTVEVPGCWELQGPICTTTAPEQLHPSSSPASPFRPRTQRNRSRPAIPDAAQATASPSTQTSTTSLNTPHPPSRTRARSPARRPLPLHTPRLVHHANPRPDSRKHAPLFWRRSSLADSAPQHVHP